MCELHNHRIVNALPESCIFRHEAPLQRLLELQDVAWSHLADKWSDHRRGLTGLAVVATCDRCFNRLASHPLIRRLQRSVVSVPPPGRTAPRKRTCPKLSRNLLEIAK